MDLLRSLLFMLLFYRAPCTMAEGHHRFAIGDAPVQPQSTPGRDITTGWCVTCSTSAEWDGVIPMAPI